MEKIISLLNTERGSAIVLAMMILIIASIIGIEASTSSSLEVQITAGDRSAKASFYKAEGAAMQAAQEIENADPDILVERSKEWLNEGKEVNLSDESEWDYDGGGDDTAEDGRLDNTYFGVMDDGIDNGNSLNMTNPTQMHKFRVFGRCEDDSQSAFIEMGYKRRF